MSGLDGAGARLDVGPGGVIVGSIPFGLRANTGAVRLQVGATALYRGADPNASAIIPLELLQPHRNGPASPGKADCWSTHISNRGGRFRPARNIAQP